MQTVEELQVWEDANHTTVSKLKPGPGASLEQFPEFWVDTGWQDMTAGGWRDTVGVGAIPRSLPRKKGSGW